MDNIKTAVNDNDTRLTSLESGALSVSSKAFTDENHGFIAGAGCIWSKIANGQYGYYNLVPAGTAGNILCDAVAPVQIPDGVTITALTCVFLDNYPSNQLTGKFNRINLTTGINEIIFSTAGSVDSTSIQTLTDTTTTTPGQNIINNSTFAYSIAVDFSATGSAFETLGSDGGVYGCTISYTK